MGAFARIEVEFNFLNLAILCHNTPIDTQSTQLVLMCYSSLCHCHCCYHFLCAQGGVVIASHDENLINHACNEIWLCKDGRVQKMEKGMEEYKAMIEALMNT